MAKAQPIKLSHATDSLDQVDRLVGHLQDLQETERTALARQLHDELGGLLVSAVMDLGWAEQHLSASYETLTSRLRRVRMSLGSAIDLKRAMTETLRPSLLDNFGLFAACRWHYKHIAADPAVIRTERYPEDELPVSDVARTHLFRIAQDLLEMTSRESEIKSMHLAIDSTDSTLLISLEHEHLGAETADVELQFDTELSSISHRVAALQGQLTLTHLERGVRYLVEAPLHRILTDPDPHS